MKETPIIMSGNHPQLIFDGIKTQTRRVIKPQPYELHHHGGKVVWAYKKGMLATPYYWLGHCPYGQVGDRLYIKESHKLEMVLGGDGIKWVKCSYRLEVGDDGGVRWFRWTDLTLATQSRLVKIKTWNKWRPARFMYRFLARILLEITEVRVERVQDISYENCYSEGISKDSPRERRINQLVTELVTPKTYFKELWDSLNAKRGYGWDPNPWVWPISFKVAKDAST